jgi:hypothetical protein
LPSFSFYVYVTKLTTMEKSFIKKIILGTVITFGLFTAAKAQTDDQSAYDDQYPQTQQQQYTQPQQQYVQPQQQYTQQQQYAQQPVDPQYNDQQSFEYYPDANVYYDNSCNRYIYNNGGAWVTVNALPVGISLYGAPYYRVYHRGPQVWLDNAIHMRSFYRGGGYRPVVYGGGYRGAGFGGRAISYNRGGGDFNRGGGFGGGNRGGFGGGNRGGGGFRQAHYRR